MAVGTYVGIGLAVLLVLLGARGAGRQAEKVAGMKATLKAVKVRDAVHEDIGGIPGSELDERLQPYFRD